MMTVEEKLKVLEGKKTFIDGISELFKTIPTKTTVESIDYEVYCKDMDERSYFIEFVVVRFSGGGYCVKTISGNSNTANFRAIGELLDGGYYKEIEYYESLINMGFTKIRF